MVVQKTAYFSGHVQGVGFRYTAIRLAGNYEVVGFVKNLYDGRVQLVVEGEPDEVDGFIEAVRERMRDYIHDVQIAEAPATGRFLRFDVSH